MSNLQYRQQKIQEKRKQTPWREFVRDIASRFPFNLYKNNGMITPYDHRSGRVGGVVGPREFEDLRNSIQIDWVGTLLDSLRVGMSRAWLAGMKVIGENENSDFSYIILGAKNAYLSIVVVESQNICFSYNAFYCSDVYNSILVQKSHQVFSSRIISNSSNVFFSSNIDTSSDIWFSANLTGCINCIRCEGLSNKSYWIDNKPCSKEEFIDQRVKILRDKERFKNKRGWSFKIAGANIGDNIQGSFNKICGEVENGFMNYNLYKARNIVFCNGTDAIENCMDCCSIGGPDSSNIYGCMGVGYNSTHVYCSVECSPDCTQIYYSYLLDTCSFCLGCIGLKNKSYCILNKQYAKEERYEKVDEIFVQMEKDGTLGQFFLPSMNPFYFNDTAAYLIDPSFSKEEVTKLGYLRRDEPIKIDIPVDAEVVKSAELDQYEGYDEQGTWVIKADILKKIIQDEQGNYYRIIPMEYKFLMKHGLPLPRKHWLERMKENFKVE